MAQIVDGKAVAAKIRVDLKEEAARLSAADRQPGLAVIMVGNDPASAVYVLNKIRACRDVGIRSSRHDFPADSDPMDMVVCIERLNADPGAHGILVQLPTASNL